MDEVNAVRKVIVIFSVLFTVFMAGLFIYYLMKEDSSRWQVSLGGIIVSALPLLLLKLKKNPFNTPIIISYFIFLFCTLFLGSITSFYIRYKWYDSPLHFYKGALLSFIAISLYKHLLSEQARRETSRWALFLFVLGFSTTGSTIWEIYEFLGDLTITHTMQMGGNKDTMTDLSLGTCGALIVAIYSCFRRI
jgi:hypothetical protein